MRTAWKTRLVSERECWTWWGISIIEELPAEAATAAAATREPSRSRESWGICRGKECREINVSFRWLGDGGDLRG